ncbi:hypothetical protein Hanom_Chr09g00841251 [Helianthus anomalus]
MIFMTSDKNVLVTTTGLGWSVYKQRDNPMGLCPPFLLKYILTRAVTEVPLILLRTKEQRLDLMGTGEPHSRSMGDHLECCCVQRREFDT